jgi:hypothetical protein
MYSECGTNPVLRNESFKKPCRFKVNHTKYTFNTDHPDDDIAEEEILQATLIPHGQVNVLQHATLQHCQPVNS